MTKDNNKKPERSLTELALGMTGSFRRVSLEQLQAEKRLLDIVAEQTRAAAVKDPAPKKGP